MATRKSSGFWAEHITAAEASGTTKAAYCRQHGLDYRTFYRWFRRLSRDGAVGAATSPQSLVPIAVQAPLRKTEGVMMTLRVCADVSLSIPAGVDAAWLARLLREVAAC